MFSHVVMALDICTSCTTRSIVTHVNCRADHITKTRVNASAFTTRHSSGASMLHSSFAFSVISSKSSRRQLVLTLHIRKLTPDSQIYKYQDSEFQAYQVEEEVSMVIDTNTIMNPRAMAV